MTYVRCFLHLGNSHVASLLLLTLMNKNKTIAEVEGILTASVGTTGDGTFRVVIELW
jgi:hypothetical protein